jgi:hypothetical protein
MEHAGSAHNSTTAQIIAAEDRGFDGGRDFWISEGIRLAIELHERDGDHAAAARLRAARLVRREAK